MYGESHVSGGPPSTLHSKLAVGSEAEKANVGVGSFVGVGSCGPDSNVTLGPDAGSPCARAGAAGAPAASSAAIDAARITLP